MVSFWSRQKVRVEHELTATRASAFTNFYGQESGALFDARPVYLGLRFSVFGLCAVIATPAYM